MRSEMEKIKEQMMEERKERTEKRRKGKNLKKC